MQRNYRFEIISVSREENFLPCSTEWDKSVYFTPSNHTITADNGKELARHQEIVYSKKIENVKLECPKEEIEHSLKNQLLLIINN